MQQLKIHDPPVPAEVDAAVRHLRAGRLVVLPTETVYGLAADPGNAAAVARLQDVKGRPQGQPFTHHLAAAADLDRYAAPPRPRLRAFLDRVWPGPLTAILPARDGPDHVGLRVPAHPFTQAVIAGLGHSLFMTSVNRSGEAPINDPGQLREALGDQPDIACWADAGPPRLGEPSVVIRLDGRRLEVLRPGILDRQELLVGAAAKVLFVCSGNTCRSPLAEALARKLAADRLGVAQDEVLAHGLWFQSAGTGTLSGMPASSGSLQAGAEAGLDLSHHRSTQLTAELCAAADRIFCLSAAHRAEVLRLVPDAGDRTRLLDPRGRDVVDPFGGPVAVYRQTRDAIAGHLEQHIDGLLEL